MLSANDWPKFKYYNIQLPDKMAEILASFEEEFKMSPENEVT